MELIRGLHNLAPRHRECAATIGNFDGVHLGHRAILAQLAAVAAPLGLPTVLMTFEPQPQEFFAGENAPARLSRLSEKVLSLGRTELDRVLLLRFDRVLSQMSPEAFIDEVLLEGLAVRKLVVGDDFRFGHRGEGNFELLRAASERHGFDVLKRDTFCVQGRRVSSTWVRDALSNGELGVAAELLGRPYSLVGRVAYGQQLGRTIGFPTANVVLKRSVSPLQGVYAVRTSNAGAEEALAGVANIGRRPTVDGTRLQLEVHLFDFDGDLYGRRLEVAFLHKLRDEQRFDSLDALKQQIARDAANARDYFASIGNGSEQR